MMSNKGYLEVTAKAIYFKNNYNFDQKWHFNIFTQQSLHIKTKQPWF